MSRVLLVFHLLGMALVLGGLLSHLILLAKFQQSSDPRKKIGSERKSDAVINLVQKPGLYLSIVSGIGLAWSSNWLPFYFGSFQFKLLFVFWLGLATTLMSRSVKKMHALRRECGESDSERLKSLKDNHQVIGYVTILSFLFVIILSFWEPFG